MDTQLRLASSAIALAAMVLIWNEAPIVDSPSDHEYGRVAYSDRAGDARAGETTNGGHGDAASTAAGAAERRERIVRGGRTGAGPAALPAKPGDRRAASSDGDRTGTGPEAEPGVPAGLAPNVGH